MKSPLKLLVYLSLILLFTSVVKAEFITKAPGSLAGWMASGLSSGQPNLYTVNAVDGSWIVENAIQKGSPGTVSTFGAQWIGIGGIENTRGTEDTPLLQIGTVSNWVCWQSVVCSPYYYPFWETPYGTAIDPFPQPIGTLIQPFSIHPGDKIYASINLTSSSSLGCSGSPCWRLKMEDLNGSQISVLNTTFSPNQTSADWEQESEQGYNTYPLSNFRAAYFGPDYTNFANTDQANVNLINNPIGDYGSLYIDTINSSVGIAYPSNVTLSSDQASFVVYEGPQLLIGNPNAIPNNINLGQNSILTDPGASGGSENYTYQWLEATPTSNNVFANANTECTNSANTLRYSFITGPDCTKTSGEYFFKLKVTDNYTLQNVTSANVIIYVNKTNDIPLSIFNNQSSPIAAGVQFAITFNAPKYQSLGLNFNLSNICVAYKGACITAWIMGNLSQGVNGGHFVYYLNQTSDLIWVKAQSAIGAGQTSHNYSIIVNNTSINNYQNPSILGANPTIWCSSGCPSNYYAGVDNGASIFNVYDNFVGNTIKETTGPIDSNLGFDGFYEGNGQYWRIDNGLTVGQPLSGLSESYFQVGLYSTQTYSSDSNVTIDFGNQTFKVGGAECCNWIAGTGGFYYFNPDSSINSIDFGVATGYPSYNNRITNYYLSHYYLNTYLDGGSTNTLQTSAFNSSYFGELSYTWTNSNKFLINPNYGEGSPIASYSSFNNHSDNFGMTTEEFSSVEGPNNVEYGYNYSLNTNYYLVRDVLPNGQQPITTDGAPISTLSRSQNIGAQQLVNTYKNITIGSLNPSDFLEMIINYSGDAPVLVTGTGSVSYDVCSTELTCLPVGAYTINVIDTNTLYSQIWPLVIDQTPTVSISPTNSILDQGQQTYLISNVLNGTGIFNYQWYNATSGSNIAISNAIGSIFLFNASTSGNFKYNLIVTDVGSSNVVTIQSNNAIITVEPSLTVNTIPSNAILLPGNSLAINSLVTGGTGNFIYQWYNFSSGIFPVLMPSQTSNALSSTFNSFGNFYYLLIVTDQDTTTSPKASAISIPVNVIIPTPTIILSPTSNTIEEGQLVKFTNSTSGGTPPYSFTYNVFQFGTIAASGNYAVTGNSIRFTNFGTYNVIESVTETADATVSSSNSVITVYQIPQNVIAYLPITITNSQSSAYSANTDVMVNFPAYNYKPYEIANMINTDFFYANGTVIPSWLEGNVANEQISAGLSSNTLVFWLDIKPAENFLCASCSNTIYMGFAGNTLRFPTGGGLPDNDLMDNAGGAENTGESLVLATYTYGAIDNGQYVFTSYTPWGTCGGCSQSIPLYWTQSGGTDVFDYTNMEFYASSYQTLSTATPTALQQSSAPFVLESLVSLPSAASEVQQFGLTSAVPTTMGQFHTDAYMGLETSTATATDFWSNGASTAVTTTAKTPTPQVIGIAENTSTSANVLLNYTSPTKVTVSTAKASNYLVYATDKGSSKPIIIYWTRARVSPPNGVNAGVSFGTVTLT